MAEKSSRMTNLLAMERDWVPTLAPPDADTRKERGMGRGTGYDLTHLNTVMRRIDMLCKLMAPLAISTFVSAVAPIKAAVVGVALSSALSWGVEYWGVMRVWRRCGRLRAPKEGVGRNGDRRDSNSQVFYKEPAMNVRFMAPHLIAKVVLHVKSSIRSHIDGLRYFYSTSVWLPSICVAILHASVLSYSGTLITYLLNAGFSLQLITIARAIGSIFEIGSTFIFPWAVGVLSGSRRVQYHSYAANGVPKTEAQQVLLAEENGGGSEAGDQVNDLKQHSRSLDGAVVRVGLWGICALFLNLVSHPPPAFTYTTS